jgi:tetratricopeptide (TPR) repeat protein
MKSRLWIVLGVFLLLAFVTGFAQTSDEELQLGIAAYKDNHYEQAIQHFEKAAQLDPNNIEAHLYLGTACTNQYIPGVDSPDNVSEADLAIAEYQKVLDLNASKEQRVDSCKGIAYLYLNMRRWEDAEKYYQMAADLDPNDPQPYYSMGVIAWSRCYQPRMEARAKFGMRPDQHLSAKIPEQKTLCEELRAKNWSVIEDGVSDLDRAIQLRADYDDAMAYMNLMYRERADLECEDPAARRRDLKTAEQWVDKAIAAKKVKAEESNLQQNFRAPNPQ